MKIKTLILAGALMAASSPSAARQVEVIPTAGVKLEGLISEYRARSLQGPSNVSIQVEPMEETGIGRIKLSILVENFTDRPIAFTNVFAATHDQPLTLIGEEQLFTKELPSAPIDVAGPSDASLQWAQLEAVGRKRIARERLVTPKFGLVHEGNFRKGIATFELPTRDSIMNWPLPVTLSIEFGGTVHRFELLVIPD